MCGLPLAPTKPRVGGTKLFHVLSIPVAALPVHIHRKKINTHRTLSSQPGTLKEAHRGQAEPNRGELGAAKPSRAEWRQAEPGCVELWPNGVEPAEPSRVESRLAAAKPKKHIFPWPCEGWDVFGLGWGAVECKLWLS